MVKNLGCFGCWVGAFFGVGSNFCVGAKILGSGENFGWGQKFWVRLNIFGGRFPWVCMGSWVKRSRYKLQSGRFSEGGLEKGEHFWYKVPIGSHGFMGSKYKLQSGRFYVLSFKFWSEYWVWAFRFGKIFWVVLGWGIFLGSGQNFGSGRIFWFGCKFWVGVQILRLGANFG